MSLVPFLLDVRFPRANHMQTTEIIIVVIIIMPATLGFVRAARPLTHKSQVARFSVAARKMAGGDAGSPRSGGAASGDAFTKREEASENLYVKRMEREKLEAARAKVKQGEDSLAKDRAAVEELEKKK